MTLYPRTMLVVILAIGCDGSVNPRAFDAADTFDAGLDASNVDAGAATDAASDAGEEPCTAGPFCDARIIDALPYLDGDDTQSAHTAAIDAYGCAPSTDESGREVIYRLDVDRVGLIGARVTTFDETTDVDVHILAGTSAEDDCLARAHHATNALVQPGRYYVVVDTWVGPSGAAEGPYELEVRFREVPEIDCTFLPTEVRMFWPSCAPGIDCTSNAEGVFLSTPAVGPVVLEAHLVTPGDPFEGWPTAAFDQVDAHYARTERETNYVMDRDQAWAPFGEGGSQWGQGATGARVPDDDEPFYVNMYWRDRPAGGTRMLAREPISGLAVVLSAGWETGPGDPSRIGGVTEEVHDYLGTTHLDPLELGFLEDETAPLGPVRCRE